MKIKNKGLLVIFILSLIISIGAFPFLDNQIPIHWSVNGTIDNYGSKFWIFLEPTLILLFWLLMDLLKKVDPKRSFYSLFDREYRLFKTALCLFLFAMQIFTLAACFGIKLSIERWIPFLVGIFFAFIGNMMPKIKPNYFMGIKTPWTIANDTVWFKTHRLAGKLWFIGGLVMALSVFLPEYFNVAIFIAITIILAIIPMFYSYLIYKKQEN